jgi:hypothetical protein
MPSKKRISKNQLLELINLYDANTLDQAFFYIFTSDYFFDVRKDLFHPINKKTDVLSIHLAERMHIPILLEWTNKLFEADDFKEIILNNNDAIATNNLAKFFKIILRRIKQLSLEQQREHYGIIIDFLAQLYRFQIEKTSPFTGLLKQCEEKLFIAVCGTSNNDFLKQYLLTPPYIPVTKTRQKSNESWYQWTKNKVSQFWYGASEEKTPALGKEIFDERYFGEVYKERQEEFCHCFNQAKDQYGFEILAQHPDEQIRRIAQDFVERRFDKKMNFTYDANEYILSQQLFKAIHYYKAKLPDERKDQAILNFVTVLQAIYQHTPQHRTRGLEKTMRAARDVIIDLYDELKSKQIYSFHEISFLQTIENSIQSKDDAINAFGHDLLLTMERKQIKHPAIKKATKKHKIVLQDQESPLQQLYGYFAAHRDLKSVRIQGRLNDFKQVLDLLGQAEVEVEQEARNVVLAQVRDLVKYSPFKHHSFLADLKPLFYWITFRRAELREHPERQPHFRYKCRKLKSAENADLLNWYRDFKKDIQTNQCFVEKTQNETMLYREIKATLRV